MPTRLSKARRLIAEDKATEPLDVLSAPDLAERNDFATVSLRAEALHASRHFGEAEAMYQRAVESRPDFAFSYYGLSLAQLALERPDASASFSRVLMLRAGPAWYSRLLDSAHRGRSFRDCRGDQLCRAIRMD